MAPDDIAPRLTLDEVDEALRWSVAQPMRDKCWRTWVDSLLDTRNRIKRDDYPYPQHRETRVITPAETR